MISSGIISPMSRELFQSTLFRDLEKTIFGKLFIAFLITGSSSIAFGQ